MNHTFLDYSQNERTTLLRFLQAQQVKRYALTPPDSYECYDAALLTLTGKKQIIEVKCRNFESTALTDVNHPQHYKYIQGVLIEVQKFDALKAEAAKHGAAALFLNFYTDNKVIAFNLNSFDEDKLYFTVKPCPATTAGRKTLVDKGCYMLPVSAAKISEII